MNQRGLMGVEWGESGGSDSGNTVKNSQESETGKPPSSSALERSLRRGASARAVGAVQAVVAVASMTLLVGGCTLLGTGPGPVTGSPSGSGDGPAGDVPDAIPKAEVKSRYGNPETYEVFGKEYEVLDTSEGYREVARASWYGKEFQGRRTSSGEPYDMFLMTAAHKTLPIPTYVRVTNLENGRSVVVRVNDRGPFVEGRIIDLSFVAAQKIGMIGAGTARVEVVALDPPARDPDS